MKKFQKKLPDDTLVAMKAVIKKHPVTVAVVIVAVCALAFGVYSYHQLQTLKRDPQAATRKERDELVLQVSKMYIVPENENPTIATVSDPGALSGQDFFVDALKDDKVLIYTDAKKAILYRPSIRKIINIAPLNVDNQPRTQ
jgi:hypothetical protein